MLPLFWCWGPANTGILVTEGLHCSAAAVIPKGQYLDGLGNEIVARTANDLRSAPNVLTHWALRRDCSSAKPGMSLCTDRCNYKSADMCKTARSGGVL